MARRCSAPFVVLALLIGIGATPASAAKRFDEHVRLTLIKKTGTHFTHRGNATGTLAGSVRSSIRLNSLSITGTVKIKAKGGSMTLKVRGTARSGGLRSRFEGSAQVVGGTGRYAKAHGKGTFSGVVNRSTWAATIDANGTLSF